MPNKIYVLLSAKPDTDPAQITAFAATLKASIGARVRAVVHDGSILSGVAHGSETDEAPPFVGFIELEAESVTTEMISDLGTATHRESWLDPERSSILVGSEFTVVPGDQPIVLAMALTRREGMTPAEFLEYWSTTHAELGRQVPGSEGYRQIHPDAALTETGWQHTGFAGPRFDGIAMACYSTDDAFRAVLANTEVAGPLLEDEKKFISHDRSVMVIGRL